MTTLDAYARFLTARWDEMEARAECDPHCSTSYHQAACDCSAKMTLADLAAKRAILAAADDDNPMLDHLSLVTLEWVVTHLADPFRDHPDHPANADA